MDQRDYSILSGQTDWKMAGRIRTSFDRLETTVLVSLAEEMTDQFEVTIGYFGLEWPRITDLYTVKMAFRFLLV